MSETSTPQPWTPETAELVRAEIRRHHDIIRRLPDGAVELSCPCGKFTEVRRAGVLDPASWARHRAEAVLAALHEVGLLLSPDDNQHVIELRSDGWTIMHPLACRPRLFDCPVNRVGEELPGPPRGKLGRFPCDLVDDQLVIDYGDDHV